MPVAIGYESYVAYGGQTAFGTPATPTITAAHLRDGSPISPVSSVMPRITTVAIMPKPSQTWNTMNLVPFEYGFELVGNSTAWLPLFTAAWGKRTKAGASAPFTHTMELNNPPVDPSTADSGSVFYNRGLTLRQTFNNVRTYEVRDACVDRFIVEMKANETVKFRLAGTGQNLQDNATPIAFVDVSGSTFSWEHAVSGANSGLYAGSANPPTTAMVMKAVTITLENNLLYEPQLGAASGLVLRLPTRADFPNVYVDIEGWFDNISATNAVTIMTDYIAATKRNFRAKAYIDANDSLEFLATGTTAPVAWDTPKINVQGNGPVGFSVRGKCYQETQADVKMVYTSAT